MRAWCLGVALAGIVASGAAAATYHLISNGADGVGFLDTDHITPTANGYAAWTTIFLHKDVLTPLRFSFVEAKIEFDCANGRLRKLARAAYNDKGTSVVNSDEVQPWETIYPDSNIDVERKLVCDPAARDADKSFEATPLDMLATIRKVGP